MSIIQTQLLPFYTASQRVLFGVPNANNGAVPNNGGKIYTYLAGSAGDTLQATYSTGPTTDSVEDLNANPIILGSNGQLPAQIWVPVGVALLIIEEDANGNVIATNDNLQTITTLSESAIISALGFTPYSASNPNGYISGNQTITLSGAVTGSGTTAISTTIANSGVTAGSYTNPTLVIGADGRITSAANGGSVLTTKGDLLGYSTTQTRIPVGANGTVLIANSSAAAGVSWSSGGGSQNLIANGYSVMLGGLYIQWGYATNSGAGQTAVTFPVAFPNACFAVVPGLNNTNYGVEFSNIVGSSVTRTGFSFYANNSTGWFYIALGY